jgi:hypothetical protein
MAFIACSSNGVEKAHNLSIQELRDEITKSLNAITEFLSKPIDAINQNNAIDPNVANFLAQSLSNAYNLAMQALDTKISEDLTQDDRLYLIETSLLNYSLIAAIHDYLFLAHVLATGQKIPTPSSVYHGLKQPHLEKDYNEQLKQFLSALNKTNFKALPVEQKNTLLNDVIKKNVSRLAAKLIKHQGEHAFLTEVSLPFITVTEKILHVLDSTDASFLEQLITHLNQDLMNLTMIF